jgi:hypothetical protein
MCTRVGGDCVREKVKRQGQGRDEHAEVGKVVRVMTERQRMPPREGGGGGVVQRFGNAGQWYLRIRSNDCESCFGNVVHCMFEITKWYE